MFKENFEAGEPQNQEAGVSDLINAKYEELQKTRVELMNLKQQMSVAMPPSAAEEVLKRYKGLEEAVHTLEQEFEDMKKARAEDLEKKFGTVPANEDAFAAPLMEMDKDNYLNRRIVGDERKAA